MLIKFNIGGKLPMNNKIIEIYENKKDYLDLLLLADEQEDMIDRYLDAGRLFVLLNSKVKCVAVVLKLNETECELKNIATAPEEQRKGYGAWYDKFSFW